MFSVVDARTGKLAYFERLDFGGRVYPSIAQAGKYIVYLPIYGSVTGTGTNGVYTLKGFAAFVVTGYHLPGFQAVSWLTGKLPCTGSDKCISGFYTQGLIPSGGTVGGSSMGATVIQLTG